MFGGMCSNLTTKPAGIYLLKVNSINTRTRCEICSKLPIKTAELRQMARSLVVSDLRTESGCYLCAEVSFQQ